MRGFYSYWMETKRLTRELYVVGSAPLMDSVLFKLRERPLARNSLSGYQNIIFLS